MLEWFNFIPWRKMRWFYLLLYLISLNNREYLLFSMCALYEINTLYEHNRVNNLLVRSSFDGLNTNLPHIWSHGLNINSPLYGLMVWTSIHPSIDSWFEHQFTPPWTHGLNINSPLYGLMVWTPIHPSMDSWFEHQFTPYMDSLCICVLAEECHIFRGY